MFILNLFKSIPVFQNPVQYKLWAFATSPACEYTVFIAIMANTLSLAMKFYKQPQVPNTLSLAMKFYKQPQVTHTLSLAMKFYKQPQVPHTPSH